MRPIYHIGYVVYFEWNIDYIIETYCANKTQLELECNCKCHLAKHLTSASDTEIGDDGIITLAESFFPVYYSMYPAIEFKMPNYFL
ncbi:hypothetical protein ES676_04145 [Bizionia saleffrena]|uniref:Uncharacterized protein n=1 Tax=Bizionia saleffrena TaxID=291189 RepID=A0A8H2LIN9_9FLAO|nr:hypothetical protein [Bizionia saleffrena]TYB77492.1 hypothetical protein ES676_04145 [Bizionia saleffrena]